MKFKYRGNLFLNKKLRKELSRPFGAIISSNQIQKSMKGSGKVYAIGDVTVATLLRHGYMPDVGIFDYRTRRNRTIYPIIKNTYKKPMRAKNRQSGP